MIRSITFLRFAMASGLTSCCETGAVEETECLFTGAFLFTIQVKLNGKIGIKWNIKRVEGWKIKKHPLWEDAFKYVNVFYSGFFISFFSLPLSTPEEASLNSRIPFPKPLASSGIFLPPKRRSTTITMMMISGVPRNASIINGVILFYFLLKTKVRNVWVGRYE